MKTNKYYEKIGSKSSRIEAQVIEKIQEGTLLDELISSIGVSRYLILKIAKKHKLKIGRVSANYKNERNQKMLEYIHAGEKFSVIADIFNVTKSRVGQLAKNHGIKRWEITRKTSMEKIENINLDIKNGMQYGELLEKYNLDYNAIGQLRHYGLEAIANTYRNNRNKTIIDEYKIKIAKKVVESETEELNSPQRIQTIASVYKISSSGGYKRYPNIGKKCLGGTQETKEVIGFILTRRNIDKLSFRKIAEELNHKKMVTIGGLPFTTHNVRSKYWSQYKNTTPINKND